MKMKKKYIALLMVCSLILGGCGDTAGKNTVNSLEDLEGKTIGVQMKTTGDAYASDIKDASVKRFNKGKDAVKVGLAILNGEDYEKNTYEPTFFINKDNVKMYGTDGWQ